MWAAFVLCVALAWKTRNGRLVNVEEGNFGVWGVNSKKQVYRLNDAGNGWERHIGLLKQVSVGGSQVWGIDIADRILTKTSNAPSALWRRINGALVHVSVSDKDNVWGVNANGYIYRRTQNSWQRIDDKQLKRLKQISVGQSGVWGVDPLKNIYYRKGTYGDIDTAGSGWVKIMGKLAWISSGYDKVCGVIGGKIWCRKHVSSNNPQGTVWGRLKGQLVQIDCGNRNLWGVSKGGLIYSRSLSPAPVQVRVIKWRQVKGRLMYVERGLLGVFGVNAKFQIFRKGAGDTWLRVSGSLKRVSVGGSEVWGVTKHNEVYMRNKHMNQWKKIPGSFIHVSVSGKNHVWGVNKDGKIYRRAGNSWHLINGGLRQVSIGRSGVWGVNAHGNIYYRKGTSGISGEGTAGQDWVQVPGKLKWVSAGYRVVVGVNSNYEICYREGLSVATPTGTGWKKLSGRLRQIDAHTSREIWGTNRHGNIYTSV